MAFKSLCEKIYPHPYAPVKVLGYCLSLFKVIQIGVFVYWWYSTAGLNIFNLYFNIYASVIGIMLIAAGQFLNFSVFQKIGNTGVLYGKQFGYTVPWVTSFPYSFIKHPQYVGTLISIWGCFLVMNFSYEYWYAIPVIETVLYILGAEQEHVAPA
jgi:methylene-fatty-acyl-phospholipid synthase